MIRAKWGWARRSSLNLWETRETALPRGCTHENSRPPSCRPAPRPASSRRPSKNPLRGDLFSRPQRKFAEIGMSSEKGIRRCATSKNNFQNPSESTKLDPRLNLNVFLKPKILFYACDHILSSFFPIVA